MTEFISFESAKNVPSCLCDMQVIVINPLKRFGDILKVVMVVMLPHLLLQIEMVFLMKKLLKRSGVLFVG